jgi:hypothetical protein
MGCKMLHSHVIRGNQCRGSTGWLAAAGTGDAHTVMHRAICPQFAGLYQDCTQLLSMHAVSGCSPVVAASGTAAA